MWINFSSESRFAIRIYLGGINAVSGESENENVATNLRRLKLVSQNKSIQDYIVTPDQLWLDGIASDSGRVRQFVAMPLGSGYSFEAQITGDDVVGGLQFEITPAVRPILSKKFYHSNNDSPLGTLFVKTLTGKIIELQQLSTNMLVDDLKLAIHDVEGIPPSQQRFIGHGKQIEDGTY